MNDGKWRRWDDEKPNTGEKIVIVCSDGCSSSLALMTKGGPIDGEDACGFHIGFLHGSIWHPLPEKYPLAFMESHDDY